MNINTQKLNAWIINEFSENVPFNNEVNQKRRYFNEKNTIVLDVDSSYNYRPDKLCFEIYQQELWYPLILALNGIGSVLQFKPESFGNKIIVPTRESIITLLNDISLGQF